MMQRSLVVYARYCGLGVLLSLILLLPWLDSYFCGDDWPAFVRNMHVSWDSVPGWFTGLRSGSYRPVHDVFIALCWRWFSLNPVGYRLVCALVYGLVCANVGVLAHLLSSDQRIGLLATLICSVFATHAEGVLWLAGTNELCAAWFVSTSMIAFVLARKRGQYAWLSIAGPSSLLAFASKETALAFPAMFFAYDVLWGRWFKNKRLDWRSTWPVVFMVLFWVAFLAFRLPLGSAYSGYLNASMLRFAMNLAYYGLIGLFLLPNNFAFWETWHTWSFLPVSVLVLSSTVIVASVGVWLRKRLWSVNKQHTRALLFAMAWSVLTLGPVIFIVSERSSFVASLGIAMVFAVLLVGMWDEARRHAVWVRRTAAAIIIVYVALNAFVLEYRCAWFRRSGDMNEAVLAQLEVQGKSLPANATVLLVDLPDHTGYTFTFRNTFPSASIVFGYEFDVKVVLDTELSKIPLADRDRYVRRISSEPGTSVFWYKDGELVPGNE
ncbi:MAG: hypothetical protein JXA89_08525 [Anaerolineae bacterium]|nr:hypothetical protein [Anaerolineae bacterium]